MSDVAIRVEGLAKEYRIGAARQRHDTLRDQLAHGLVTLFRRGGPPRSSENVIWALEGVSFDVARGEVLGIIGRNGAGKSTLLKILSRITEPTSGQAEMYGQVGSLLEVGTGFHPELTGRENVYLNGAILGMSRREINHKFDEIVSFAGVEKFIHTPVKRYSSGMYVRLAFAVAAHLEPDILIVDEVLAVGDAAFQGKCLGKMKDVAREGRTVLFVSHNMGAVQGLCRRALWLDQGRIQVDGVPQEVISGYLDSVASNKDGRLLTSLGFLEVERVLLLNGAGQRASTFGVGESLAVEIHYFAHQAIEYPHFWVGIEGQHGSIFAANMLLDGCRPDVIRGRGIIRCRFKALPLLPQMYTVSVGARDKGGECKLVKSGEVATFKVMGVARSAGLKGEYADTYAWGAAPVLVPYEWCLPDGKIINVDPIGNGHDYGG